MATTKEEIKDWFKSGVRSGSTHLIIVCDTFDWEDYPVYVAKGEDPKKKADQYRDNMQRVMEVYNLSMDMETQLNEDRSFNY